MSFLLLQVHNPSWIHHQSYIMPSTVSILNLKALGLLILNSVQVSVVMVSANTTLCFSQGAVLTPGMDHTMSIQPTSMMGPLTQQLSHLSMGSSGTVSNYLYLAFSYHWYLTVIAVLGNLTHWWLKMTAERHLAWDNITYLMRLVPLRSQDSSKKVTKQQLAARKHRWYTI